MACAAAREPISTRPGTPAVTFAAYALLSKPNWLASPSAASAPTKMTIAPGEPLLTVKLIGRNRPAIVNVIRLARRRVSRHQ
jgi:hypothetical protein